MSKKVIFIDIDGTLTMPGSNVPPESAVKAINAAKKKGHKVLLCTGRNMSMLSPLMKYGFDGAVACAGGHVILGNEVIYSCPMTETQKNKAMKALEKNGIFRTVEAVDATYGDEGLSDFIKDGKGNSEIERWRKALAQNLGIRPMSEYDGRPLYKIVFMCNKMSQLEEPMKALEKDFLFCMQSVPAHSCINGELINRKFNKGKGVLEVCKKLGIPPEHTYGFGDSMNDIDMIDVVGTGVCMSNGSEELKERSDIICPPVESDGLSMAFSLLGLS